MPTEAFLNLEESKKNLLLESAIHEFSMQSYEKVSIFKIAQKAGVSRSGFYYYFNDKEDIYNYLIEELKAQVLHGFEDQSQKYDVFTFANLIFHKLAAIKGTPNEQFIRKVVENLKSSDTNLFFDETKCYKSEEDYQYLCDLENLKITSHQELRNLLTLLFGGTVFRLAQYFEEKESLKEAEEQLTQMFDIIKYGVLR